MDDQLFPYKIGNFKRILEKKMKQRLKKVGVSPSLGFFLVMLLDEEEGLTLKEMSETLNCDKGYTTRVINELFNLDYIKRLENQKLKKYKIILTQQGKDKALAIKKEIFELHEEAFKNFTLEERKTFKCLMEKFLTGIREEK